MTQFCALALVKVKSVKIIKPLRLGVLQRPYRIEQQNYLGVTILALTDMSHKPQLRPEVELWQLAASELTTNNGVFDLAIPKAHAEFLATGFAFSQPQENTITHVRIEVDSLSKSLFVSGDRYWKGRYITPPEPFTQMRLDWSQALGGENYAENPWGKGIYPYQKEGVLAHPLPNIELPAERITTQNHHPDPAGFSALDILWPRRFKRIGKHYDTHWFQHHFPGFSHDTDWRIFNAASPDQWWINRDTLPLGASWNIWNMHPEIPHQQGSLPCWQGRCFVNQVRKDGLHFEEITMRATTVWFFPHKEQMVLMWQGCLPINEDDAADVLHIMPALDEIGAMRPLSHYHNVFQQRLDKEHGSLLSFREKDLIPESCIGPWLDNEVDSTASPMHDNQMRREAHLRQQYHRRMHAAGHDIEDVLPAPSQPDLPALDNLAEYIEQLEKQASTLETEAKARRAAVAQSGNDTINNHDISGHEAMKKIEQTLITNKHRMSEAEFKKSRDALHQLYLISVLRQAPAKRITGDLARITRSKAIKTYNQGGDFSGMDLTGMDFSGMDLHGANFSYAKMECADLSHCQLDGASFQYAVLARSELHHSSLCNADMRGASLALASCNKTDFSGTQWDENILDECFFDECCFIKASLSNLLLRSVWFNRCSFNEARLDNCIFMEQTFPRLSFEQAVLEKVTFLQSRLENATFRHAYLDSCTWANSHLEGADFSHAIMKTCSVASESNMMSADFNHATLTQSNLRQTKLRNASFIQTRLDNTDLSEADCQQCDFTQANLSGSLCIRTDFRHARFINTNLAGALLTKSLLSGVNFHGANLFRADLAQCVIDATTDFNNTYTKQIKILPKQVKELL